MISGLKGRIVEVSDETVLLDVRDVYYEVSASLNTLSELAQRRGQDCFILTYTHVREDIFQLYGFLLEAEKSLFLNLLKVSGIGPKSALHILSGARVEQIMNWIDAGDVKSLTQLPKLGKKTAEQLILTLRGKLVLSEVKRPGEISSSTSSSHRELTSALVNLGFRLGEVERVVQKIPTDLGLEEGIRYGLRELSSL